MLMYIKPYIPYIDYFFNKEYIAEELCENKEKPELKCHGQCHLKKEITKTVKEEKEDPTLPSSNNKKESKQLNLFVENQINEINLRPDRKSHFFYQEMMSFFTQRFIIPPPESSFSISSRS